MMTMKPGEEWEIGAIIGKRKKDDDDLTEDKEGLCRFVRWQQDGIMLRKNQCTWEPNDGTAKFQLDKDELVGHRIKLLCSGRWWLGEISQHVSATKFHIVFDGTKLDRDFDLELPSADRACQEWHLEGFSEYDVAKPEGLPDTCKYGACAL